MGVHHRVVKLSHATHMIVQMQASSRPSGDTCFMTSDTEPPDT